MSDLVKKLRSYNPTSGYSRVMREAADRINELEEIIEAVDDGRQEFMESIAHKDRLLVKLSDRISELEAKLERVQCAADELAEALADD